MADISLVLKPDFAAAQKALQEVAATSTTAAERFQQFNDKMKDKAADDFVAKQRAIQAALTATQGETAGAQKAYDNYRKEIERLIQNGLDPQSEYIQRLSSEMQALERDTENLKQANKDFSRDAAEGQEILKGIGTAAVAAAAAVVALIASYTDGTYAGKLLEDSVKNLKEKVGELVEPIIDKVVPAIAEFINGLADFITGSHEMQEELEILAGLVAVAAATFTAFFLVANQAKIIDALAVAFKGVTAAIKTMTTAFTTNPIGMIAVAVAGLIAVIIILVKNWDTVKLKVQEFADNAQAWLAETAAKLQLNFSVAINSIKQFFLSLAAVISDKVLGAVGNLLNALSNIPFIGDHFATAAGAVDGFNDSVQASIAAARQESAEAEAAARQRLAEIAAEKQARKDAADQAKRDAQEQYESNKAGWEAEQAALEQAKKDEKAAKEQAKADREKEQAEAKDAREKEKAEREKEQAERKATREKEKAEREKAQAEAKAAREQAKAERDQEKAEKQAEKEQALRDKANADAEAKERKHQQEIYNIRQTAFNASASLISSLGELMMDDTDSKKAFEQNKAISAATAGINTALAFTQALTDPSQPSTALRVLTAAAVLAAGVVQQKKILSATYRSAASSSAPSISVPRGTSSASAPQTNSPPLSAGSVSGQSIVLQLDSRVLYSSVNEGIRDGLVKRVS
jgi:hypothetical protein